MLPLLHARLVHKCFLLRGGGVGWVLINFLGSQGGHLFKVGAYSKVGV